MDRFIFLKKQLLIIATAITGVKLGGCGISLDIAKINIKPIGKISCLDILITLFILIIYILFTAKINIYF